MKIILSTFLRLKYGIKIYVSPVYFLIDFDMERKVCTFFITIIIIHVNKDILKCSNCGYTAKGRGVLHPPY